MVVKDRHSSLDLLALSNRHLCFCSTWNLIQNQVNGGTLLFNSVPHSPGEEVMAAYLPMLIKFIFAHDQALFDDTTSISLHKAPLLAYRTNYQPFHTTNVIYLNLKSIPLKYEYVVFLSKEYQSQDNNQYKNHRNPKGGS